MSENQSMLVWQARQQFPGAVVRLLNPAALGLQAHEALWQLAEHGDIPARRLGDDFMRDNNRGRCVIDGSAACEIVRVAEDPLATK